VKPANAAAAVRLAQNYPLRHVDLLSGARGGTALSAEEGTGSTILLERQLDEGKELEARRPGRAFKVRTLC